MLYVLRKQKSRSTRGEIMNKYKYVVWVGGCDDYCTEYEQAKEHCDEWIKQGYDDVHLLKQLEVNDD